MFHLSEGRQGGVPYSSLLLHKHWIWSLCLVEHFWFFPLTPSSPPLERKIPKYHPPRRAIIKLICYFTSYNSNRVQLTTWWWSLQAFAWFSDLLVEHSELFWSLFAVDMDQVLSEQPQDTWDSFPLFQVLNDYLRNDGEIIEKVEVYVKPNTRNLLKKIWDIFTSCHFLKVNIKNYN